MSDDPDRLFEQFRQRGDAAALGRVFDATAPRLLQIAVHLVGDIGAAEDLVQATFVTAIERAATYESSRSLDAWLAGILANHARDLKKAARREIDIGSLVERVESTPLELALQTEWSSALAQALDGVPEPYRVVLILRLQHGMKPTEIAHALQRSPGAVRVQLHRGREMLRRLLPAGILASASFLAEPARGLAEVKVTVIAHAHLAKSTLGIVGLLGGLVVSSKTAIALAALIVTILVMFLLHGRAQEPVPMAMTAMPKDSSRELETSVPGELASEDRGLGSRRASADEPVEATVGRTIKLHGRVVDSDSAEGVPGAEVDLFAPRRESLAELRRRYCDRFALYDDGGVYAIGWPTFGEQLSSQERFDLKEVLAYVPPESGERPIARTTTDARGEFAIRAPESLGFLVCEATGYATRLRALSPAEVNSAKSDDVAITIALRAPRPLQGYVVDEDMQRIARPLRFRLLGHLTKQSGQSSSDPKSAAEERQIDQWTVDTDADGSFEARLPAKLVRAESLEPDLVIARQGFVRGGTFVDSPWTEPGLVPEPLVLVMKPVRSILVLDRDTRAPIEEIRLKCVLRSTARRLIQGRYFAPQGRMRLVHIVDSGRSSGYESSDCFCTVWADGYLPETRSLENLVEGPVVEFDLQRCAAPALTGRIHDGASGVGGARIALSLSPAYSDRLQSSWSSSRWTFPVTTAATDAEGKFSLVASAGSYVLHVVRGPDEASRFVELPSRDVFDLDFSVKTSIAASLRDSTGAACAKRKVVLSGFDGRVETAETDASGLARFAFLPPGHYDLKVMTSKDSTGVLERWAEESVAIELRPGEERRIDVVLGLGTPRFARLVVDGAPSLAGWRASIGRSDSKGWVEVGANGRIPADIRGQRAAWVLGPDAREWLVDLPEDAPDGYEICLALSERGYEGVLRAHESGLPLAKMKVWACALHDPSELRVVAMCVTDDLGRFRLIGLKDDEYRMSFEPVPFEMTTQDVQIEVSTRPAAPLAQLDFTLPRKKLERLGSYDDRGFEGIEQTTLRGAVHRASGVFQGLNGYVHSVYPHPGYRVLLRTRVTVGPDGRVDVRVPLANRYAAALFDPATGRLQDEIEWNASGANGVEPHDLEVP